MATANLGLTLPAMGNQVSVDIPNIAADFQKIDDAVGALSGIAALDASGFVLDSSARRVVDSGSNSNGAWVRYSNGTQICAYKYVVTGTVSTRTVQSLTEYFQDNTWTYPAAFTATPNLYISGVHYMNVIGWGTTTATQARYNISRFSSLNTTDGNYLLAVGRWY